MSQQVDVVVEATAGAVRDEDRVRLVRDVDAEAVDRVRPAGPARVVPGVRLRDLADRALAGLQGEAGGVAVPVGGRADLGAVAEADVRETTEAAGAARLVRDVADHDLAVVVAG